MSDFCNFCKKNEILESNINEYECIKDKDNRSSLFVYSS